MGRGGVGKFHRFQSRFPIENMIITAGMGGNFEQAAACVLGLGATSSLELGRRLSQEPAPIPTK